LTIDDPPGTTPLSPDERDGLRFKHIKTRGELDELEQANILSGLQWLGRKKSADVLTSRFAVSLHKQLFGEVWDWAGVFRRTGKNIGVDPMEIEVSLRMAMDDARYWAQHGTYEPVEAAARFHHRLVFIHPFPNGNGRHARILADAMLRVVYDAQSIDWAGGQDLQNMTARRAEYIAALKAADRGHFEPLLSFVQPSRSTHGQMD
jgi:Fic-DOC domain mobile mystery protein B